MASLSGSEGVPPDRPFPFPGVQDYLLEGTAVYIGTLSARSAAGAPTTIQVVAIGVFEGQLLVCLPQTAWHRLSARRLLGPGSLKKGVHCEVVASSSEDPAQAHAAYRLKVWLGLLSDSLVGNISYEEGDEPACCFKGFGPLSAVNMVPFGPALSSIASEHFAFVTAVEGGSDAPEGLAAEAAGGENPEEEELSWEDRLTGLESGLTRMQRSIEQLLAAGAAKPTSPVQEAPLGGGTGLNKSKTVHPGLDPTVVAAARQAGIPEDQLRRMSDLAMAGAGPKTTRPPTAKAKAKVPDALDESDEEAEPALLQGEPAASDPVSQAVVTMSKILAGMQKDRERSNDLEHLLDRADGGGGEGAGGLGATRSKAAAYQKLRALLRNAPEQISASIESLMAEDFAQVQSGPRQEATLCSARGWIEHRSHLQQYPGPIRNAWLLGGIVDAINSGSPEQAKAMALLGIAALDQASIDGGNWLLASEYSLETAPPFSAFQRPRTLDPLEAKQTRLLDQRWVSLFMSRLKERDAIPRSATSPKKELEVAQPRLGAPRKRGSPILHDALRGSPRRRAMARARARKPDPSKFCKLRCRGSEGPARAEALFSYGCDRRMESFFGQRGPPALCPT